MLNDVRLGTTKTAYSLVCDTSLSYNPCKHSRIASSQLAARTGLLRYMSIPIAKKRSLSPDTAFAVNAMILVARIAGSAWLRIMRTALYRQISQSYPYFDHCSNRLDSLGPVHARHLDIHKYDMRKIFSISSIAKMPSSTTRTLPKRIFFTKDE